VAYLRQACVLSTLFAQRGGGADPLAGAAGGAAAAAAAAAAACTVEELVGIVPQELLHRLLWLRARLSNPLPLERGSSGGGGGGGGGEAAAAAAGRSLLAACSTALESVVSWQGGGRFAAVAQLMEQAAQEPAPGRCPEPVLAAVRVVVSVLLVVTVLFKHYRFSRRPTMPGYLSNRLVAFIPAEKATVDATIEIIQGDIDDLSLNLGV
jgi:hypothetical protein